MIVWKIRDIGHSFFQTRDEMGSQDENSTQGGEKKQGLN